MAKQRAQDILQEMQRKFSHERTCFLIKPDGVRRGLIGEILGRMERAGLRVAALGVVTPTHKQMEGHYPKHEAYLRRMGERTLATYSQYNIDPVRALGTADAVKIGTIVREWLVDFMCSGPIVKAVIEGPHAIEAVRKLTGATIPLKAELGTIRGDFATDTPALANLERRPLYTVVHASETVEEAEHEIKHWFKTGEIADSDARGKR